MNVDVNVITVIETGNGHEDLRKSRFFTPINFPNSEGIRPFNSLPAVHCCNMHHSTVYQYQNDDMLILINT